MALQLADRLREEGHRRFVGREDERMLLEEAITHDPSPYAVLFIHGPGGVGKTTLLHEFAYLCGQRGVPTTYLDARFVDASPSAFLAQLREAMELPGEADVMTVLGDAPQRHVLLIDTFEAVASLEAWLFHRFLPGLSAEVIVVVACRRRPASRWRSHPAWRSLMRVVPLRNLSRTESLTFLREAGLPEEHHRDVVAFTHGHPLALALVSELYAQRPDADLTDGSDPDVVHMLLDRFATKVPTPAHRAALEACAVVRYTTQPLLAHMAVVDDAHDLFQWLRRHSFVETGALGLFPHDVAREALCADLRWRHPERFAELTSRARAFYTARLSDGTHAMQHGLLSEYVFLHRHSPVVRPFFDQLHAQWSVPGTAYVRDAAEPSDVPALEAMVRKHEGARAAEIAAAWFARQPGGIEVYRDADGAPQGFLLKVDLCAATPHERDGDPVVRAAWEHLRSTAPLRPGEGATLFRFWMDATQHQAVSPVQSLIFASTVRHYLTSPGLAYTFLPCAEPALWTLIFSLVDLERLPDVALGTDGDTCGLFGHDWRVTPPAAWLDVLAQRDFNLPTDAPQGNTARAPVLVLSRDAFTEALRDALRNYARPSALRSNPLLQSRVVLEAAERTRDDAALIEALRSLLREAAATLQGHARHEKSYRALDRTYFRPAPTQEAAADLLGIPYSTFRRHLTRGVAHVGDVLWDREITA